MWWVDILWDDEWLKNYAGPFSSQDEAESYGLMLTGDSSDYHIHEQSQEV